MRRDTAAGKLGCNDALERELRARGFRAIAGIDEVGRGALFGPVVAAAVILAPERPVAGLNDSKLLSAGRREELAGLVRERAVAWAVAAVDAATIDFINIHQASRLAMRRAVEQLATRPDYLLVDAVAVDLPLPQQALIKGDARVHSIAAASIVAKVHRDAVMRAWHNTFPEYGLDAHKGYGTAAHLAALARLGPTPLHRRSFAPVRAAAGAA
jgi:ribonuclease HII